jgi:hypothetical protein
MADLIDLDVFVKPDIRVKLNGQTYRLPGDPQADTLLRITALFADIGNVAHDDFDRMLELREELSEQVAVLFQERNPDVTEIRMSDEQLVELVSALMNAYNAEEEAADAARHTAPSKKTRTSRSSRPSSARARKQASPSST